MVGITVDPIVLCRRKNEICKDKETDGVFDARGIFEKHGHAAWRKDSAP